MTHRAVFLDRDGTINEEVGYVNHIERFNLLPRVGEAIRLLNQHDWKTVVVSNQSGVARGYFPESLVHRVHQKMRDLLKREGAHLDGIYYCPHHPDVGVSPYRPPQDEQQRPVTGEQVSQFAHRQHAHRSQQEDRADHDQYKRPRK